MLYRERNQYLPVMMMLRLAIQQGEAYHNEHISMIVHDAQQLYLKKQYTRSIGLCIVILLPLNGIIQLL